MIGNNFDPFGGKNIEGEERHWTLEVAEKRKKEVFDLILEGDKKMCRLS